MLNKSVPKPQALLTINASLLIINAFFANNAITPKMIGINVTILNFNPNRKGNTKDLAISCPKNKFKNEKINTKS